MKCSARSVYKRMKREECEKHLSNSVNAVQYNTITYYNDLSSSWTITSNEGVNTYSTL